MRTTTHALSAILLLSIATQSAIGQDILFKDDFKSGLSDKWTPVGLKKTDYRVRNGGLEMRVQSGKLTRNPPMLKVLLPFTSADSVAVSVKVSLVDQFTQDHEFAGVCLLDESGLEFVAKKERIDGKLVFAPSDRFKGKPAGEGDPTKDERLYTVETKDAGPLRITVDRGEAFFQVGPSTNGKYHTFFNSALRKEKKERGFCLIAAGAPDGASHWVRFEDFRVVKP